MSFPRSTDTRPEVALATRKDVAVPPPHPAEFRRRAIELARQRTKPMAEVAKDLRISESYLRNWVAQADADERGSQTRLPSAEKAELAQFADAIFEWIECWYNPTRRHFSIGMHSP